MPKKTPTIMPALGYGLGVAVAVVVLPFAAVAELVKVAKKTTRIEWMRGSRFLQAGRLSDMMIPGDPADLTAISYHDPFVFPKRKTGPVKPATFDGPVTGRVPHTSPKRAVITERWVGAASNLKHGPGCGGSGGASVPYDNTDKGKAKAMTKYPLKYRTIANMIVMSRSTEGVLNQPSHTIFSDYTLKSGIEGDDRVFYCRMPQGVTDYEIKEDAYSNWEESPVQVPTLGEMVDGATGACSIEEIKRERARRLDADAEYTHKVRIARYERRRDKMIADKVLTVKVDEIEAAVTRALSRSLRYVQDPIAYERTGTLPITPVAEHVSTMPPADLQSQRDVRAETATVVKYLCKAVDPRDVRIARQHPDAVACRLARVRLRNATGNAYEHMSRDCQCIAESWAGTSRAAGSFERRRKVKDAVERNFLGCTYIDECGNRKPEAFASPGGAAPDYVRGFKRGVDAARSRERTDAETLDMLGYKRGFQDGEKSGEDKVRWRAYELGHADGKKSEREKPQGPILNVDLYAEGFRTGKQEGARIERERFVSRIKADTNDHEKLERMIFETREYPTYGRMRELAKAAWAFGRERGLAAAIGMEKVEPQWPGGRKPTPNAWDYAEAGATSLKRTHDGIGAHGNPAGATGAYAYGPTGPTGPKGAALYASGGGIAGHDDLVDANARVVHAVREYKGSPRLPFPGWLWFVTGVIAGLWISAIAEKLVM